MNNNIYESDPDLTKELEKSLMKTLSNRSIAEGFISSSYLTTAYYSALGMAKSVENIQNQYVSTEMGQTALALTSAGIIASAVGAGVSAHAGRNLDIKRFTLGAAAIPLFAVWLNSAIPDKQPVEPMFNNINTPAFQSDDIPTIDVEPE